MEDDLRKTLQPKGIDYAKPTKPLFGKNHAAL